MPFKLWQMRENALLENFLAFLDNLENHILKRWGGVRTPIPPLGTPLTPFRDCYYLKLSVSLQAQDSVHLQFDKKT